VSPRGAWGRWICGLSLACSVLPGGSARAQAIDADPLEDCVPRVIAGTPAVSITQQATRTNAQIYGAVALAEGTLLPRHGLPVSFHSSAIFNVNRLPTVAACRFGQRYGMASMDMFATAAGFGIPIPVGDEGELRIVYAGSISGTLMHFPSHTWPARSLRGSRWSMPPTRRCRPSAA